MSEEENKALVRRFADMTTGLKASAAFVCSNAVLDVTTTAPGGP